jgi:cyclopropane-fatty-acyl-phospholipid synthase
LDLLGTDATPEERSVLAAVPYNHNDVILHRDPSLMPTRRACWTSWNLLGRSTDRTTDAVCVTYWLNKLQNLPADAPDLFVTLNPIHAPNPDTVYRRLSLAHPVFSKASTAAQQRLPSIQNMNDGGIYFAGAWCGYGFHEDGLKSAVHVVIDQMGGRLPWRAVATSPKLGWLESRMFKAVDSFMAKSMKRGDLRVILPNGYEKRYGSGLTPDLYPAAKDEWWGRPLPKCTLRVINLFNFVWKVSTRHDTGLGEAWMDGDIECSDPGALMAVIVENARDAEASRGALGVLNWIGDRLLLMAHAARHNSEENSRKNIEEHYDAGNEMYKLFLDETMTYSCGIHAPGRSLKDAQLAKIDAMITHAGIKKGEKVLEIGCGWGAMAIRAAQRTGCKVIGLTLSKEQLEEANARVKAAHLEHLVTLMFCDYRQAPGAGTYDRVISCEMIEAVGHEYLPSYFQCIGRMLKPGGKACVQAITMPDERYEEYCATSDFIREHIFPGGHLPSIGAMIAAAEGTGLALTNTDDIGPHYAVTLRAWREKWQLHKLEIRQLGYTERFWRKWQFYFAYCEAAFDAGYIRDFHVVWEKRAELVQAETPATMTSATTTTTTTSISSGSDLWTQGLAALWFYLLGVASGRQALLAVVPATTAALVVLLSGLLSLQARIFPATAKMVPIRTRAQHFAIYLQLPLSIILACGGLYVWLAHPQATRSPAYLPTGPVFAYAAPTKVTSGGGVLAHYLFRNASLSLSSSATTMTSSSWTTSPGSWVAHMVATWLARLAPSLTAATLVSVLVCLSAGQLAFRLWFSIQFGPTPLGRVAHRAVLLSLFAAAAYGSPKHTPMIAATLVGEAVAVPRAVAALWDKTGTHSGAGITSDQTARLVRSLLRGLEVVLLVVAQLGPHAWLLMNVVGSQSAFEAAWMYRAAVGALAYHGIVGLARLSREVTTLVGRK